MHILKFKSHMMLITFSRQPQQIHTLEVEDRVKYIPSKVRGIKRQIISGLDSLSFSYIFRHAKIQKTLPASHLKLRLLIEDASFLWHSFYPVCQRHLSRWRWKVTVMNMTEAQGWQLHIWYYSRLQSLNQKVWNVYPRIPCLLWGFVGYVYGKIMDSSWPIILNFCALYLNPSCVDICQ